MKKLQVIILLVITFIIGLHFKTIMQHIKNEIKQSEKVQYCNDVYLGHNAMIQACLMDTQSKY